MFAEIKLAQVVASAFVGLVVFAGGAYFMVDQTLDNQPPMPMLAAVNPSVPPAPLLYKPAADSPAPEAEPEPAKPVERKKAKSYRLPTDPPAEADALQLMGMVVDVKVTRRAVTKDRQFDALVRDAQRLAGEDLYPGAIAMARRLKQSPRSEYLVITSTNTPWIEEVIELLGEPNSTQADLGVPQNRRVTWHYYPWLSFGTRGGKVTTVRLNCQTVPATGLGVK
jgi:hypothetical protein